MMKSVDWVWF